jgi:phosphatidylserine decarboxylase
MPPALAGASNRLMTIRGLISALTQQEDLNFLLTNRVPRAALTRFMGWFSKIENSLVRDASIACWRLFSDLDLSEARKTSFKSLHDCFTRELRPGLRPPDPDPSIVVSPSDGIVGAFGAIEDTELFQIKGAPYSLLDLLGDPQLVDAHRNGRFVTLRLTSSMYHRFHASHDCRIEQVRFISGDTWNVNPIALKRIERLFCKNERAVIRTRLRSGDILTLVPVAAILVASIRLHFLDRVLNAGTPGPAVFPCDVNVRKGDELGWFEHGSTI